MTYASRAIAIIGVAGALAAIAVPATAADLGRRYPAPAEQRGAITHRGLGRIADAMGAPIDFHPHALPPTPERSPVLLDARSLVSSRVPV